MTISIFTLFSVRTIADFLQTGLDVARALGLPVDTWREGDPTRSDYHYLAEALATLEVTNATYIKAGFLSSAVADAEAAGDSSWLKVLALEVFGVTVDEATYATSASGEGVSVTNGTGFFDIGPGDITFRNSATEKTYHNTDSVVLSAPGQTHTFEIIADEAGADSSSGVDEIDEIVTTLLGVTVTGSDAVVGQDEATPKEIQTQCLASLGALSPNGPPDAYEYICRNSDFTGVTDITRAKAFGDSDTGLVTVYVAGASGAVAGASVTAAQEAVDIWSTPLCINATVENSAPITVAVTATITGEDIPASFEALITAELGTFFASLDIGADVFRSAIIAAIHKAVPEIASVTLTVPAADTTIAVGEVPVLGTVTVTEV